MPLLTAIADPITGKTLYADEATGECVAEFPPGADL